MTLSRSPSPHTGGGWSSPGLNPGSDTTSSLGPSPGILSPGTPVGLSWAAAKAKSDEVRGYPSFATRNSGFFSRQRHKILARFSSLRGSNSREYVDKDEYGRQWKPAHGGGHGMLGRLGRSMRPGRLRLPLALLLVWIGYLFFWASKWLQPW